jgi:hypothetical protein
MVKDFENNDVDVLLLMDKREIMLLLPVFNVVVFFDFCFCVNAQVLVLFLFSFW